MAQQTISATKVSVGGIDCEMTLIHNSDNVEGFTEIVLQEIGVPGDNLWHMNFYDVHVPGKDGMCNVISCLVVATAIYTMLILNINQPLSVAETTTDSVLVPAMNPFPNFSDEHTMNETVMQRVFG